MNSASIFDWVHMVAGNVWLYGGAFLLVLGVLVFVHEWGHYIIARACGVRIESFSIGFGPELFGYTTKRGTRWKVSAVPLGGYVKMFGDVDPTSAGHSETVTEGDQARPMTGEERKVAFFAQPVARRAAIVFAGPAINFLFAIAVLTGLYTFYGEPVTQPVAAGVIVNSAAAEAGFLPHDKVLSVDGKAIYRFEDIRREVLVGLNTARTFSVLRDGKTITLRATPKRSEEKDRFGFRHASATLGLISPGNGMDVKFIHQVDGKAVANMDVARAALTAKLGHSFTITVGGGKDGPVESVVVNPPVAANASFNDTKNKNFGHLALETNGDDFVKHPPLESFRDALRQTSDVITSTLKALGQMITGLRPPTELGGIIRIGAMAGDMAKDGTVALISFAALLSINLGLVNLFPIPMLDGGHLLFYGIESVKGSPIPEKAQEYAFRVGLAILVCIMLFANLNDIVQLIL